MCKSIILLLCQALFISLVYYQYFYSLYIKLKSNHYTFKKMYFFMNNFPGGYFSEETWLITRFFSNI